MHEDASIDQTRMKDYTADRAIIRRDGPVVLKASSDSVDLDVNDRMLLSSRVLGFVLRSRTWAALNVNLVKDRSVRPDGFDQLVLPRGHKELVQALVETHSQESGSSKRPAESGPKFNLVKGKGKGLIILCHGVPGLGKTSTAECIADYTKRPGSVEKGRGENKSGRKGRKEGEEKNKEDSVSVPIDRENLHSEPSVLRHRALIFRRVKTLFRLGDKRSSFVLKYIAGKV